MPPLILSTNDSVHTNDISLSDAPAVWLTGDRIRFINSESGRVITTTAGVAAIRMDGADGVVINQAGGVIRSTTMDRTQLVIQGSAGSDRVENEGTIIGLVALGEGSDTFISRRTAGDFQNPIDLGGGDDVYHLQSNAAFSSTAYVDGGTGTDRCIISETSGNVGGFGATNFEILEIRGNGYMEGFNGFETILADFRAEGRFFTAFRFSTMPDAQIEILAGRDYTSLNVYDRSAIGGVTGSDFADSLDLGNDTIVSGTIDLRSGNDYMVVRRSQFENPQQSVFGQKIDGGAGTDRLSVQLQGGDIFDAGNVVNFEDMEVGANGASSLAMVIRNVDHVPLLIVRPFYPAPIRLEASDMSAGSVMVEPTGSLIIAADSVVGLVYSQTPFPIDTAVADDTKSLSIVNEGQILGEVRLYIGDDLLDSRAGTIGGHVFGYSGNDRLLADAGDNWLDGGAGADYLSAGVGNDVLIGGSASDTMLGGTGDDRLYGESGNDGLLGGAGDDVLDGGDGNDSMHGEDGIDGLLGGMGDDSLSGGDGNDSLHGQAGADTLLGGAGNDFLSGGEGVDVVYGGTGDDIYISDTLDYIVENEGEGFDLIYASASYTLSFGQHIEIVSTGDFGGTNALDLGGNELGNILWGNAAVNVLSGFSGNDSLHGFNGNDGLLGGEGDDFLDGGEGDDSLFGDAGADTLAGGAGNDFFAGGAGADIIYGGAGNDTYIADALDYIVEAAGGGSDLVYATASFALSGGQEIETLAAGGDAGAINLAGNELANNVWGNGAANTLNGGGGADVLIGYGGNDVFAFTTAAAAGNADTIADFAPGDRIALDDAAFNGIGTPGSFNAAAFVAGSAAADANDRIVYNSATGQLFYDADGNAAGAAILIATLTGNPVLSASDFQVI